MSIQYSDGVDIEAKILDIVKSAEDLRSQTLVGHAEYHSWPVRYHLTPLRSNLVRHLNFQGLDVLELGAGMGGVSRFVAENCRHLTAVEGTQARFDVLSARLRDLQNWDGCVANLQAAPVSRKYDVVCLFGVLEYAELYVDAIPSQSAHQKTLLSALSHLKEDGVLLVAIENRLGAKYLAGADEDHLGRPFTGITGYPAAKSARTFSRPELRRLLESCGLTSIRFDYPWPDYKIPSSVLTEEMMTRFPRLALDIACAERFESYGKNRPSQFSEYLFLESVIGDLELGDFSNSFLVSASRAPNSATARTLHRPEGYLGSSYSSPYRKNPVETRFTAPSGSARAEKIPMHSQVSYASAEWTPAPAEAVLRGEYLKTRLLRRAQFNQGAEFLDELIRCQEAVFSRFSTTDPAQLRGEALDALLTNAVKTPDGSIDFFDLEWKFSRPIPKSWHIFRNLCAVGRVPGILHSPLAFGSLTDVYHALMAHFHLPPSLAEDLAAEAALQFDLTQTQTESSLREAYARFFSFPFAGTAHKSIPDPTPAPPPPGRNLPRRILGKAKRWIKNAFFS